METVSPRPLNRSGNSAESPDSGAGIVPYGLRFAASAILLCLMLLLAGCGSKTTVDILAESQTLFNRGKLEDAATVARTIPKGDAVWAEAQYLLGRIETSLHGVDVALPYFKSVPRQGTPISVKAVAAAAELEYQSGRLSVAIEDYRFLTETSPDQEGIESRLSAMLKSSGQRSLAEAYLFDSIKKKKTQLKQLVWFSAPDRISEPDSYLIHCAQTNAADPLVQMGMAFEELRSQKYAAARKRLEELVRAEPALANAQAMLGELYLDGSLQELERWHAELPATTRDHAEIWYVRGQWARRLKQSRVAARCFWETIRQTPTHQRAMYQLGQLVSPIDPIAGNEFAIRANQQKKYAEVIEKVMIQFGRDPQQFQEITTLLTEMGRDWEAWAWAVAAADLTGKMEWSQALLESLAYVPDANPPRTRPDCDLALRHNLSSWPGFETLGVGRPAESTTPVNEHSTVPIRFEDRAIDLGVDFTYFASHHADSAAVRIFESTGGGTGVIDFDLDGWPDLFLTQGVEWPMGEDAPKPSGQFRDRLFRNRGNRFDDVTDFSCPPHENGYGQGCSAGDFDNDGFPDLYVANIGANQLLRNNGDGTLSDVSQSASLSGVSWTTSCLIADLNADGNPDLYDVNYLQGEHLFSIECGANRCSVRGYEGAPDQVQLSHGDGTFQTIADATPKHQAKGLGIVLFHVDQEPRPSLFIANDQVPNFFLRPAADAGRFTDEAPLRGLAVNMYGQSTASMGVAAGDVNRDGLLDLFVTNFEGEAKNLFLQSEHGFFEDSIFGSGIMSDGIPYVGWGTQFLDADNDGELDLVATNGHIADFRQKSVEYRMPIQFFRGIGPARFAQIPASETGSLFLQKLFGRSLATLDWNRDGRTDFVVSCISSPAVIATGQSPTSHHWLDVRLHARSSSRDATGAIVEVQAGNRKVSRQLVAGDGYQASNERRMHFGLGPLTSVDRVIVQWPSGDKSTFETPPIDTTIHLLEGRPFAVEHSRDSVD